MCENGLTRRMLRHRGLGQYGTRENRVIRSFVVLFTEGDGEQIKDSVVDGTCSTQGGNEE